MTTSLVKQMQEPFFQWQLAGAVKQDKEKMRVLTFTSLFPNAQQPNHGIFIFQRTHALANVPGNTVRIIAPVPYFPSRVPSLRWHIFSRIPRDEKIGGLPVCHPRYPLMPKIAMPVHGVSIFLGSMRTVQQFRGSIDCIDAHYVYPDGMAAVLAGKLLGAPVIVSARGTDINLFPSFRVIRPMIIWTLRQAAGIIAVSAALKDAIVQLGLPPEKVRVIPNGVDTERFRLSDRTTKRIKLGIPVHSRMIVSVASLKEAKGHQLLIRAAKQILTRYPEFRLYIVGDGPDRLIFEKMVKESNMLHNVIFVGSRPHDEIGDWFSAADVSCLVSSREGMPNVVLESLASGTPVVATRIGGIPEILVSTDLGITVEPNVDAISAGLMAALEKQWDREMLIRHAQTRTWKAVAQEVDEYLREVSHWKKA